MEGFRYDAHPMGIFLSTVGALSTLNPDAKNIFDPSSRRLQTRRLIAKVPGIAAYAYRHSIGRPYNYPDNDLSFTGNFLNMATSDLGKPTPDANGDITVDRGTFFAALAPGTYQATVSAIDSAGLGRSSPTTFTR